MSTQGNMKVVELGESFTLTKNVGSGKNENDFSMRVLVDGIERVISPDEILFTYDSTIGDLSMSFNFSAESSKGKQHSLVLKEIVTDTDFTGSWYETAASAVVYVNSDNRSWDW